MGFQTPLKPLSWELKGPPGPMLDMLLAAASQAGWEIEPIACGVGQYRLVGNYYELQAFAKSIEEQVSTVYVGFSLAIELPPDGVVRHTSKPAPASPSGRTMYLHGTGDAFRQLRLAIDANLQVTAVGVSRWAITGRTSALMAWAADAWCKSVDEMLTLFNLTPADVEPEDAAAGKTAHITVTLPETRTTTTNISRNAAGDIVRVDSKTVDVG